MDKSWMQLRDKRLFQYRDGVKELQGFAFMHTKDKDKIFCPHVKCNNYEHQATIK